MAGTHEEPIRLGCGIYSLTAAARLADMHPSRVRRWVEGYSFRTRKGERHASAPVMPRDLPRVDGRLAVTFHALVEILVVKVFLEHGVSMYAVRKAAQNLAKELHTDHPFAVKGLRTDGRSIFGLLNGRLNDDHLIDLVKNQVVFKKIVERYLKDVDYDTSELAEVWWPMGRRMGIVVDPRRSFGAPIVARSGIPTAVLAGALRAERGNATRVAAWFDVPERDVRRAARFERKLAA